MPVCRHCALVALAGALSGSAFASAIHIRITEEPSGVALPTASGRLFKAGNSISDAETESDKTGRIDFEQLEAGEYRIEIVKAGYVQNTVVVRLGNQDMFLPIGSIRTSVISGSVKDDAGKAVGGAVVLAMRRRGSSPIPEFSKSGNYAIVNGSGEYRIHGLVPGEYVLVSLYGAAAYPFAGRRVGFGAPSSDIAGAQVFPETASPEVVAVGVGEERGSLDFRVHISQPATLSGRVRETNPGTRFRLSLSLCGYPFTAIGTADADEAGRFEFRNIASGSWCLMAVGTGERGDSGRPLVARAQVDTRPDGTPEILVEPKPAQDVSVNAAMASVGTPPPRCTSDVSVEFAPGEDWPGSFARHVTLRPGRPTVVPNVVPSPYMVLAVSEDRSCYDVNNTPIPATGGATQGEIVIPMSQRSEVSALIGSGKGVASRLTLLLVDRDVTSGLQRVYAVNPDGDGRAMFANLRSGSYGVVLRSSASNDRGWTFDFDLPPGRTEVELPGPATDVPGR